ncbi:SgcJ/EcaC family oxidoreductase [Cryptosporangium phraense]|uniref:SgcJ/EcaC family oxidoreductase n=1 Tax=Cryptosporangium phraense TaxID=2593070 RepID=A0A545AX65_9ACTN|nr:SgcJ/EcaC family oxidoreductase [Cryptosporangium phraense]TQS45926.1 SgcJ/EcaC family oxidoreductase [Cryptosporangium phraense]
MTNTDLDALADVVATLEHSQQHELPDEFIGLFRDDAFWTTAHGKRLFGRDEIAAFTRQVLPGAMAESTATYEIEHVLFLRPDVAAVKVRQRAVTLDGEPIENEPPGSPLYVLTREDGEWRIAVGQNTIVLAD